MSRSSAGATPEPTDPGSPPVPPPTAWASELLPQGGRPIYLACGPWEMRPQTLSLGETVTIDGLASYKGYHADIGRTIAMGPPSMEQRRKYEALRGGFHQVYGQIRPG